MLSAAPFSACNCLLSAGVVSARLASAPDSLNVHIREGNNHFFPYVLEQAIGRMQLIAFQSSFASL